jgi:hypothetical protein
MIRLPRAARPELLLSPCGLQRATPKGRVGRRPAFAPFLVLVLVTTGCGRVEDTAPPVATPSVTLSRPEAAVGSPIDMTYRFAVTNNAPAFAEDYWVFVHFLDTDGELMWTDDHQPPTPTRQWKPGAAIEYARTMFIPKFPYTGETRVDVGLFSPESGARVPLQGQNEGMRSYRVATFNLRLQSDNVFVVFNNGWHETEVANEVSGLEWQWTRREATLSFRNPKRESVLFLQLDQPVNALAEPQKVDVRIGPMVIDSFTLPAGMRELRRVSVSPDQFGSGETVDVTIAVDRTFVPASIPELRSTDSRELGVRVFRAFVQPK